MAASLGSLVVSLGLDAAQFTTGLTKSEAEARKFAQTLDRAITTGATLAGAALVILGGAAVTAFAAINNLARQAGNFQDLAEKTGMSAEAMASFQIALEVTNKSADDLATFSVKLSKNIAGVQDGTDKAGAAIQALGLDIKAFKALDPDKQIDALSKALSKFSDIGGGKAAVLESIAKGGAGLLPFLKELNEEGGRSVILTEAQIKQADAYADAQARAKAELHAYAQVVAIAALPAITSLIGAFKEYIKSLVDVDAKSASLKSDNAITDWADRSARAVAFIIDAFDGLKRTFDLVAQVAAARMAQVNAALHLDFAAVSNIGSDLTKQLQSILQAPLFSTKLEEQIAKRKADAAKATGTGGADRPRLNFAGAQTGIDASKNILDGQLKALEASIAREKDILNARADYLQDYFRDGLLSVSDYYGKLQQARDTELANVLHFLDLEIEAETQFKAKAKNAQERQQADNKIADIQEKQNKLLRDAATLEEKTSRERNRATQEYADQLDELNAKMLDLAGNTAAAAAIRFDAQNRVLLNTAKASGDTVAVAQVAALKKQAEVQGEVNDITRRYSLTLGDVSIAQAKIDLLASTGAITEIDAINRRSEIALQYVGILKQQADAAEIAANKLQGMDKFFALQNVARFRLEIDALAASTDVLAKKFSDVFSGAVSTFFTDLIDHTKSAKQAFLDMSKSIEQQISRIASQNIAESLFGKGGPLGGVGGFFSSLFGGKGPAAGATGAAETASIAALGTAASTTAGLVTATDVPLVTFSTTLELATASTVLFSEAVTAAAAASAASSAAKPAGDFLSALASAVASGGSFAGGGSPPVGRLSLVGEDGPELFMPKMAGTVIPLDDFRSRRTSNVSLTTIVNVPQGTSRASADQIGIAVARATQRAAGKLG